MTEETLRKNYEIPLAENFECDLTNPKNLNPIIDRAKQQELTGILLQTIEKSR